MRKPVVDYRQLRLSNITEPRFRHLLWLLGWVGYFALYFLTENLIPAESCYSVHSSLDDLIPFCEVFVLFYTGWYVLVAWSLLYFALYNTKSFADLQKYIIITQAVAMFCYIVFPTRQDLRPETFPRDNVLTWVMGLIYSFDTSTGVCPSLHVAYSLGIASVWLKEKGVSIGAKIFVTVFVCLICVSVAFVKQHSVIDIFAAIPLGILAEAIVYGKSYWIPKFRKSHIAG